jgi:hypothetical protein
VVGKGPRDLAGHLPYHVAGRAAVYFLRGRLRFGAGDQGAPFPSALAVWGAGLERLAALDAALPGAWRAG